MPPCASLCLRKSIASRGLQTLPLWFHSWKLLTAKTHDVNLISDEHREHNVSAGITVGRTASHLTQHREHRVSPGITAGRTGSHLTQHREHNVSAGITAGRTASHLSWFLEDSFSFDMSTGSTAAHLRRVLGEDSLWYEMHGGGQLKEQCLRLAGL